MTDTMECNLLRQKPTTAGRRTGRRLAVCVRPLILLGEVDISPVNRGCHDFVGRGHRKHPLGAPPRVLRQYKAVGLCCIENWHFLIPFRMSSIPTWRVWQILPNGNNPFPCIYAGLARAPKTHFLIVAKRPYTSPHRDKGKYEKDRQPHPERIKFHTRCETDFCCPPFVYWGLDSSRYPSFHKRCELHLNYLPSAGECHEQPHRNSLQEYPQSRPGNHI